MYWCESCPGTATPKEFLDQDLNEDEDDEKLNYYQWETMDRSVMTIFTATNKEYKEMLLRFNKTFLHHKAKNCQFLMQEEI